MTKAVELNPHVTTVFGVGNFDSLPSRIRLKASGVANSFGSHSKMLPKVCETQKIACAPKSAFEVRTEGNASWASTDVKVCSWEVDCSRLVE